MPRYVFLDVNTTVVARERSSDGTTLPQHLFFDGACVVSQNQPIYQALLDKAASYPADKAKTYKTAAVSIAASNHNLYEGGDFDEDELPGVCPMIEEFINDFIQTDPTEPAVLARERLFDGTALPQHLVFNKNGFA